MASQPALIDHEVQPREEWRPGVSTRMRVSALTGAEALSVFEQWCAPGIGAPTHWHPVEEILTVIAGEAEIWIGDDVLRARAGHSMLVPPKTRHGFKNAGDGTLHMLAVLASPVFEAHFDGAGGMVRRWSIDPDGA